MDNERSINGDPYPRRHLYSLRLLTFVILGVMMSGALLMMMLLNPYKGKNRMHSRVFYLSPQLHNSRPETSSLNLHGYGVTLKRPIDNRQNHLGDKLPKGHTVEQVGDFFGQSVPNEINNKILTDLRYFGASQSHACTGKQLGISTTMNVFYPYVKGFGWGTCYASVSLEMTATLNDSLLLQKTYSADYSSSGLDKAYEGSMASTLEQGANVTLGMTLRKALDVFYADLAKKIPQNNTLTLRGTVTDEETGDSLNAVVDAISESDHQSTVTRNGCFSLALSNTHDYRIEIHSQAHRDLSTPFSPTNLCSDLVKNYTLRPMTSPGTVLFAVGSDQWLSGSMMVLDRAVYLMEHNSHIDLELHGYTDIAGDRGKDKALSAKRARKIKNYLIDHGIARRRIKVKARGATQPVAQGNDEMSHRLNRRVMFVIVEK